MSKYIESRKSWDLPTYSICTVLHDDQYMELKSIRNIFGAILAIFMICILQNHHSSGFSLIWNHNIKKNFLSVANCPSCSTVKCHSKKSGHSSSTTDLLFCLELSQTSLMPKHIWPDTWKLPLHTLLRRTPPWEEVPAADSQWFLNMDILPRFLGKLLFSDLIL